MRVFVTGATGFIGVPVCKELIAAGHQVLGLARSDDGARLLASLGVEAHRGELHDLESLKSGAAKADAVIHTAFIHDFSRFQENCAIDGRAIEAMGAVLAGSTRPFIVTSGTGGLAAPGKLATENDVLPPNSPLPRVSEQTAFALIDKGVSSAVMRLPQVHDPLKQGLVTYAIAVAREKGVSAYVGDGSNRWPAAHVSDVAKLYRLALEKHETGARWHAVAEEGVPMREIAESLGRGLKLPVKSLTPEEAQAHFGWLALFAAHDLPASSAITRRKLDWNPVGPTMLEDLDKAAY
ncbi:MAG TPA: SDR family oxidoreductase [Burkholderiaceae bacterium]